MILTDVKQNPIQAMQGQLFGMSQSNSALANQAATRRPVRKRSKAALGNGTNAGSGAEVTTYLARQS